MTNYKKGRRREYEVMKILKYDYNCDVVFRTAKSHSIFDVGGISTKDCKIYFVQVKCAKKINKSIIKDEYKNMRKIYHKFPAVVRRYVKFAIFLKELRKEWQTIWI